MWHKGYQLWQLPLPLETQDLCLQRAWPALDSLMQDWIQSELKPRLLNVCSFTHIEHMLALRDALDPQEEDGIWHDDGSRLLAFSCSLNFFGLPQGGSLGIRKKNSSETSELGPYPPGTIVVFQTGQQGFEHRTARVTQGLRLVCAGWCS